MRERPQTTPNRATPTSTQVERQQHDFAAANLNHRALRRTQKRCIERPRPLPGVRHTGIPVDQPGWAAIAASSISLESRRGAGSTTIRTQPAPAQPSLLRTTTDRPAKRSEPQASPSRQPPPTRPRHRDRHVGHSLPFRRKLREHPLAPFGGYGEVVSVAREADPAFHSPCVNNKPAQQTVSLGAAPLGSRNTASRQTIPTRQSLPPTPPSNHTVRNFKIGSLEVPPTTSEKGAKYLPVGTHPPELAATPPDRAKFDSSPFPQESAIRRRFRVRQVLQMKHQQWDAKLG